MPTAHEIAQKAADIRAELDRAYFETFTSDLGKLVLEDLKRGAYIDQPMFKDMATPIDPLLLAGRAGVHSFVLRILERVERVKARGERYISPTKADSMLTSEPEP